MRLQWFCALPLGWVLGCGGEVTTSPPDGGPTPDGGRASACTLEPEPARLSLRVGGHARLTLGGDGWSDLFREDTPALEVEASDDALTALTVRAGYTAGRHALRFVADCGTATASVIVPVDVEPLRIEPAAEWTEGVDGPVAREYFSMWMDPLDPDRLWLFGGFHYRPRQFTPGLDVWSLDLQHATWAAHADGPSDGLPGAGLASRPDGYTLRYGGLNVDQIDNPSQVPFSMHRVETSTAGLRFTSIQPQGMPGHGDYQPSLFFHPPTDRFYAACGVNERDTAHCEVTSFDPATETWSDVPAQGDLPPGRNGHFWAYDDVEDRLIVFGGEGWPGSATCTACRHDTWALEMGRSPPEWVRLAEDGGALGDLGRRNGSFVLDPVNRRLLVWGGTPDGRTTFPGLFAFDLRRGHEGWAEVPLEGPAPERASGAAVFDAARARVLVGFGNGNGGVHADLWSIPVGSVD